MLNVNQGNEQAMDEYENLASDVSVSAKILIVMVREVNGN